MANSHSKIIVSFAILVLIIFVLQSKLYHIYVYQESLISLELTKTEKSSNTVSELGLMEKHALLTTKCEQLKKKLQKIKKCDQLEYEYLLKKLLYEFSFRNLKTSNKIYEKRRRKLQRTFVNLWDL